MGGKVCETQTEVKEQIFVLEQDEVKLEKLEKNLPYVCQRGDLLRMLCIFQDSGEAQPVKSDSI